MRKVVMELIQYLSDRNLDDLLSLFAKRVDWYIPGDIDHAPWLGKRNSREEIKEHFELFWGHTDLISLKVENIFLNQKHAVISGKYSIKIIYSNKLVTSQFSIQISIQKGLITRYRLLEDSYLITDSLKH